MEYKILNLPKDASISDAHKAYINILKKCHPDKFVNKSIDAQENASRMIELAKDAYDKIVKTEKTRTKNDRQIMKDEAVPFFMSFGQEVDEIFQHLDKTRAAHKNFFSQMRQHIGRPISQKDSSGISSGTSSGITRMSTSYSYSNVNGNVKEEAYVNGEKLSDEELQKYKNMKSRNSSSKLSLGHKTEK